MLLAVLALSVLVAGTAMAAPGDPDLTFDADGGVTTDFDGVGETAYSVAIQPDGKIVAAGHSWNGTNQDFALTRYNPNGSLDTAFSGDGMLTTDFVGGKDDIAYGVAIQPDGKIVVAGNAYGDPNNASNRDFALARYNPNGTLDTSFDADGRVLTDFGNGRVHIGESAYSVAIQSDGRIVAAGYTGTATSTTSNTRNDFALARYNPNGSLDTSFGTGGKATADILVKDNVAYDVAVQPDGKIVAGGSTGTDVTGYDFALARFNTNGALDAGFGAGGPDGDGRATADLFGDDNLARSLALQSDGKIVLGGYAYNGSDKDFALARFNTNGALDAGFGAGGPDGDGRATADFLKNIDELYDIVLQPDGKIVAAGAAYEITESPNHHFALARFGADGAPDAGFGTVGKVTTDFDGDDEEARGLAIQPDGKIVAAGYAHNYTTSNDFALVRYAGATTDSTAPKVTTTTPGGTGVKQATNRTATFSEAMEKTTINRSTFKLFKCPSTTSTSCTTQITNVTVSPSTDGLRATLNPYGTSSTLLSSRTKYKAVVTTGAKDLAGNALDQNPTTTGNQQKAWYFTTGS